MRHIIGIIHQTKNGRYSSPCYRVKEGSGAALRRTIERGLNTKIHLAVDANGMPVRIVVTEGTRADCKEAIHLIKSIDTDALFADRGYDTDDIVAYATGKGMEVVIPIWHLVENAFLKLKRWRGIATRYAKRLDSFVAAVQIRCIALWLNTLA